MAYTLGPKARSDFRAPAPGKERGMAIGVALCRTVPGFILPAVVVAALFGSVRPATASESVQEFDRRITAELEAIDPEAARLFKQANAEREKGRHAEAASVYSQVFSKAPSFVHALRRECGEEQTLGHRPRAIALCRQAVSRDESS